MISLHNRIERDFREWLTKNGEAGATFGEQGRYTVINLTENAEGDFGLFVGYPVGPFYKGDDIRHLVQPMTRQLREHIENCVLEKYQQAIG